MEVKDCKVQLQGTVYIDSIFLLNLVMDFYLLALTGRVMGRTATFPRILAGSLAGALGYCVILCLPGITYMLKVLFGMLPVGALMIEIAYPTKELKGLIRGEGYLFTFSFLIGGFIIFLKEKIPLSQTQSDSITAVAGMGFLGFVLCRGILCRLKRRRQNHFCRVYLPGEGGRLEFTALIDTGNGLIEPVSQKPVAILEEKEWSRLKIWMRPEKFKMIPYHSIGQNKGMLEGYEVDTMEVRGEAGERQFDKVIIAVFKGRISQKGSYQMILPPELSI